MKVAGWTFPSYSTNYIEMHAVKFILNCSSNGSDNEEDEDDEAMPSIHHHATVDDGAIQGDASGLDTIRYRIPHSPDLPYPPHRAVATKNPPAADR